MMVKYGTGGPSGLIVEIKQTALDVFAQHRQTPFWKREAGGQLFAKVRLGTGVWTIERATGPRRSDIRSRFGFLPDRRAEQREIDQAFSEGLHYVGDWHTHPELRPRPSQSDLGSMAEMARESRHELPGFLMVIVGTEPVPNGLWVSFHRANSLHHTLCTVP